MEFSFRLPLLDDYGVFILAGIAGVLFVLEWIIPLRRQSHARLKRYKNNVLLSLIGMPAARLLLLPLSYFWAAYLVQLNFGLLNWLELPLWADVLLGCLALDYAIYLWHRINHHWPFLWRFHNVHHIDLNMDISTGIRFHFGEMLLSIPFRLLAIALFGVSPFAILLYEIIFEAATLFHHSNIKLPKKLERGLAYIMITPRQHGIHHSIVKRESNSNFGTVLNLWDKLHATAVRNVPQSAITIGIPGYLDEKEHGLRMYLIQPFKKQRPWRTKEGEVPKR